MFSSRKSAAPSGGYNLTKSLRFRASANAYLNRTPAIAGNRRTFTFSAWAKIGGFGTRRIIFGTGDTSLDNSFEFEFYNDDKLRIVNYVAGPQINLITTSVYRDPSAWYHLVMAVDTTQATDTNRVKLYVNGTQVTSFSTATYPSQDFDTALNTTSATGIGRAGTYNDLYYNGYLAEVNFIDGQQLDASSFGQTSTTTGVWQPKEYTGTYGTNGFYLDFEDTSSTAALGYDAAGSNDFTVNNISLTSGSTYDSMTDVPTLTSATVANYAVMNPLDAQGTATLTDANLTLASSSTTHRNRKATFVVPSTGKWYWELTTASTSSSSVILGWGLQTTAAVTDSQAGNANTWMAQNDANQDIFNQTTTVLSTGSAVAGGSIRQVAYDSGTGKLWFGVNNTWYSSTDLTSGNPSAGTNECMTLSAGSYFPTITCYNLTANVNFGQQPFAYTPPTGFVALNTFNLSAGTITTSGSFTGNAATDGPFIYLNGVPTAMTINGNSVTFGTDADKLSNGFKVRSSSASYNASGSNTYSISTTSDKFKFANAQPNP